MTLRPKDPRDAAHSQGLVDARADRGDRQSSCPAVLEPYYRDGYREGKHAEFLREKAVREAYERSARRWDWGLRAAGRFP